MPAKSTKSATTAKPGRAPARRRPSTRTSARERPPAHGEIAQRAYFIHLEEGCPDEVANWLRAERELTTA